MSAVRGPVPAWFGPRGFHWLVPGLLGGAARPGLFRPLAADLEALARVGTRLLVTLTEEWEPDPGAFARFGIDSLWLPLPDRGAPGVAAARELCTAAAARIAAGEAVVYHCRAGKGRTGTLLALQLVHAGFGADEAVARARRANPAWIENAAQEAMVAAYARAFPPPAGGPAGPLA